MADTPEADGRWRRPLMLQSAAATVDAPGRGAIARMIDRPETTGHQERLLKKFIAIPAAFLFFGFFALAYLVLATDWYLHKQAPDQPIDFSHTIHVGKVGLQCSFCHETADKSTYAGIPSVEKCMSCHKNVATDRPEIQKLAKYWNEGKVMEWNRVHRLRVRNHVYFSHKRHVRADIDCVNCHGEVKYMDKIRQVKSLEMGWCVQCHRENDAPTDCLTCHM